MALPKRYRLTRPREFTTVYQRGKRASTEHMILRILWCSQDGAIQSPRFGITVSQKVSKQAVVRNRLKRQVRAALQTLLPNMESGFWAVVVLRPASIQCDYGQILRELEQLLITLEVIHGN